MPESQWSRLDSAIDELLHRLAQLERENVELRRQVEELSEGLREREENDEIREQRLKLLMEQREETRSRLRRIRDHVRTLEEPMQKQG